MARRITPLTATQIKQTKPKEKDYKLSDGGGLYLLVTKAGANTGNSNISVITKRVKYL